MALKAILDKLDGVPEAQRALYVERDGRFVLDVDQESAEEAFASGLKKSQAELLKDLNKAKTALRQWDGKDAAEYDRLKAAVDEQERKKAEASGNWQAQEKQMKELHAKELAARDSKAAKALKALDRRKDAQLATALHNGGARKGMLDLLKLEGSRYLRLKELDEDYAEEVIDPATGAPMMADGSGSQMTIDLLVNQVLKVKYPDAFEGTGSSGGGASRSTAGGGGQSFIAAGDGKALLDNLEGVAKGTVQVR